MLWWTGCPSLGDEVSLLLADAPASFDGRYFPPFHAHPSLARPFPFGPAEGYSVIPFVAGDSIRWIDSAGYMLAESGAAAGRKPAG